MAVVIDKYEIDGNKLVVDLTPELKKLFGISEKVKVGDLKDGETFGCGKYVVVEHFDEGKVGVVCNEPTEETRFGDTYNYNASEAMKYVVETCLEDLKSAFGDGNLFYHSVNLETMDGYDCYGTAVLQPVSVMTFDQYRKYHKFIGNCNKAEWTSTARSNADYGFVNSISIRSDGVIQFDNCNNVHVIRPYFELDASVLVDL